MATSIRDTAKATFAALRRTPAWAGNAVHTLLGSRFFVATSGLFFTAFLGHVTFASTRFPPVTKVSFTNVLGFAPDVGSAPAVPGVVSAQAQQAVSAGIPYVQPYLDQARIAIATYFNTTPDAVVWGNYAGLIISGAFFMLGLYLLARQEMRVRN